jgi:hypothetical protein
VQLTAIANARTTAAATMAKWTAIKSVDVAGVNAALKAAGLPSLATTPAAPTTTQPAAAPQAAQPAASDRADALSEAARRGDAAKAKELLDAGVDVNTKFRYDRMALSFAADRGHVEVVKLLIDRGADLNAKDTFYNATALTWAVNPAMGRTPQHAEVVKLLLQRGAQGKRSGLMGALGDAATVKAILEVGGAVGGHALRRAGSGDASKESGDGDTARAGGREAAARVQDGRAQLARFVGTYQGHGNAAQAAWTITVADGRLSVSPGGSARLTLIARDQTTFGIAEQPGATVTFRLEQDKAMGITVNANGNTIAFTRSGEK